MILRRAGHPAHPCFVLPKPFIEVNRKTFKSSLQKFKNL